jgi:HlyD family secretion protein
MPTTELLVPNVADDSKPLSPVAARPLGPDLPSEAPSRKLSPRVKRAKWWWVVGLAAAVGVAALLYFRKPAQPVYAVTKLDRGDIEAAITATGTVNAVKTVQVGSQVSGNILALYADFNTKVKRGQLVARIDPAIFQARVDQTGAALDSAKSSVVSARASIAKAESDIAGAQANVASQKANLVRAQSAVNDAKLKSDRRVELVKEGIIAKEDGDTFRATYDQAVASLDAAQAAVTAAESSVTSAHAQKDVTQTQLDAAQAQVKQATATLQQSQLDLAHTQIAAPVDGTVISRNMDVGQTVAASFQAPTIFQIAQDLTQMQVDTNVDESDVGPIRVGQKATFTVDAYPGVTFPGQVAQIRQAAINVQNVVTYDVVVGVSNAGLRLFPGMTANVRIINGAAVSAVRLPVAALRFHPSTAATSSPKSGQAKTGRRSGAVQTQQVVYVLEGDKLKPVPVKLGLSDGNYMEVLSGLTEGEQVVTGAAATSKPAASTSAANPPANTANPGTRRFGF